jgi:hypothetical protein
VTRVRGTKNPERARIAALAPHLVTANREENRKLDVARLREDLAEPENVSVDVKADLRRPQAHAAACCDNS